MTIRTAADQLSVEATIARSARRPRLVDLPQLPADIEAIQRKLAQRGIVEQDVEDAVSWARRR